MSSLLTSLNRYDESVTPNGPALNREQCKDWFIRFVLMEKNLLDFRRNVTQSSYPVSQLKYKNNPLRIENYPDSDKLNDDEKEFCRVARLQPSVYLRVKTILILESNKNGSCSYSRARKIAGIDVNKTRLVHNFMLNHRMIKATK
jgi:hypothetical protein